MGREHSKPVLYLRESNSTFRFPRKTSLLANISLKHEGERERERERERNNKGGREEIQWDFASRCENRFQFKKRITLNFSMRLRLFLFDIYKNFSFLFFKKNQSVRTVKFDFV